MKRIVLFVMVLVFVGGFLGCNDDKRMVKPLAPPVVHEPAREKPIDPAPASESPGDPYQHKPTVAEGSELDSQAEYALVYQAKLDLLRLVICSEETVVSVDDLAVEELCRGAAVEHFVDLGYRVLDGTPCPTYNNASAAVGRLAAQDDVDLFVMLRVKTKQRDKFGDFYLFEAKGSGKILQVAGSELLATKSAYIRGKRGLDASEAATSALEKCGRELAEKLSYVILRKSSTGVLVRRVEVEGLNKVKYADYITVELAKKPGVQSVSRVSWNKGTKRAVFWVRVNADAVDNLAAYLEQLDSVRLKVNRVDQTGIGSRK